MAKMVWLHCRNHVASVCPARLSDCGSADLSFLDFTPPKCSNFLPYGRERPGWPFCNRILKSTVPGCGHRRDSPNACIISRKGASDGELSSAVGRAVQRHRKASKILAYGGLLSGAVISGHIGPGAGAVHTATSECLGQR